MFSECPEWASPENPKLVSVRLGHGETGRKGSDEHSEIGYSGGTGLNILKPIGDTLYMGGLDGMCFVILSSCR